MEEIILMAFELLKVGETDSVKTAVGYTIAAQNAEEYIDGKDREEITMAVYAECEDAGVYVIEDNEEDISECFSETNSATPGFEEDRFKGIPNILYEDEI